MYDTIMVHAGTFHADDVMCVAIMKTVNPDISVVRVNRAPEIVSERTILADIGLGKYDHHQIDCEFRPDGKKHAACGLIFRDFGYDLFPERESAEKFVKSFIIPIEDQDNGLWANPFSSMISLMNPDCRSTEDPFAAFMHAVEICMDILQRSIKRAYTKLDGLKLVEDAYKKGNGKVTVLPEFVPWQDILIPTDCKYVVFPSNRGGYAIQAVPTDHGTFNIKEPLPDAWLNNKPEGCTFVHTARFFAAFENLNAAVTAAYSLN